MDYKKKKMNDCFQIATFFKLIFEKCVYFINNGIHSPNWLSRLNFSDLLGILTSVIASLWDNFHVKVCTTHCLCFKLMPYIALSLFLQEED